MNERGHIRSQRGDAGLIAFPEPIRLVVWDLDNTFWSGVLTEGGIEFVSRNLAIVKELASRGIISSICSKNDFDSVKLELEKRNAWDFFVLPSISWGPKGPQLRAMVEEIQLRAESILLVDDNRTNLEEAKHLVPGIQTADEGFIASILEHPQFRGKPDPEFKRLKQYQLLEKRKRESVGIEPKKFLKQSDLQVSFEYDVEAYLDRAIDLINRTNQLNFTKIRLPEELEKARQELRNLISHYNIQCALVKVTDRYGDHGFCGFYAYESAVGALCHFCFSCRILGMGVEKWVYNRLGRPAIAVSGEVLVDLFDSTPIDWINQNQKATPRQIDRYGSPVFVVSRGPCTLQAIGHYFRADGAHLIPEHVAIRNGTAYHVEHSVFLRHGIDRVSSKSLRVAQTLGFLPSDFKTHLFDRRPENRVTILSFTGDAHCVLYKHRRTGLVVPFEIGGHPHDIDLTSIGHDEIEENFRSEWARQALQNLRDNFECIGQISEAVFKQNIVDTFFHLPFQRPVFIVEDSEASIIRDGRSEPPYERTSLINKWLRDICSELPNVHFIQPDEFIFNPKEMRDRLHYERSVYYRIYSSIAEQIALMPSPSRQAAPPRVGQMLALVKKIGYSAFWR